MGNANPDNLPLVWDQGRIHFTPSEFFYQASYYVDRMFADEWLPVVLNAESSDPKLDVTVKQSEDGKVLTLYVTNLRDQPTKAELKVKGFQPSNTSVLRIGSPNLEMRNSVDHPDKIISKPVKWKYYSPNPTMSFPAYSFTSIRLSKK